MDGSIIKHAGILEEFFLQFPWDPLWNHIGIIKGSKCNHISNLKGPQHFLTSNSNKLNETERYFYVKSNSTKILKYQCIPKSFPLPCRQFFHVITLKQTIFFSQLQLANNFFTKKVTPDKK